MRRGTYPVAAETPIVTPKLPTLVTVLGPFIENQTLAFQCPDDANHPGDSAKPGNPYYVVEGLSYEYRESIATTVTATGVVGNTRAQILDPNNRGNRTALNTYLVFDFDDFHAPKGNADARFFLYMDGHVNN